MESRGRRVDAIEATQEGGVQDASSFSKAMPDTTGPGESLHSIDGMPFCRRRCFCPAVIAWASHVSTSSPLRQKWSARASCGVALQSIDAPSSRKRKISGASPFRTIISSRPTA